MAKQFSDKNPDVDTGELSEKELERKRRQEARREAKRQKQELRRIERQMKEPVSKWIWISVVVIVVLLAAISWGGFLFYSSYTANLQRKSFMDNYNVADLSTLRRYAPDHLKRVEELKEKAKNIDGALSHGDIIDAYRQAEEALAQAQITAKENADAYKAALNRFTILREQAVKHKLDQYAGLLWKRVEEAEKAATGGDARDFSAALATEKLNQAIEVLRKAAESYPDIERFDTAYRRFLDAFQGLSTEECMRNAPDAWSTIQTRINRAEAARGASNWAQATRLYREATDMIPPIKDKVQALKDQAEKALGVMEQGITAARNQNMPREKPDVWTRVQSESTKVREAVGEQNYRAVQERAQQVTALLGEAGERARQAQQMLTQLTGEVRSLYRQAREDSGFFARNYAQRWNAVERRMNDMPALEKEKTTVEQVAVMRDLATELKELLEERKQVFSDLTSARERLANLAKAPLFRYLEANYPTESQRILELRKTAQRRLEQADMREARDLLQEAADTTRKLLDNLVEARTTVLRMRASISRRRQQFDEGIRRFLAPRITGIEQRFERLGRLVDANLYGDALEVAGEIDGMVPAERYEPQEDGTVIDFERGLMWVADGNSLEGGNAGIKLDWYAALKWADGLNVAGRTDWRLPSPEELRDLHRLPAGKRAEILPNTFESIHWTKVPSQDVDKALAVDVATGRTSRQLKQQPFHVRAVSQPGTP